MIETHELYPEVEMYKPMLVLKAPANASELMASKTYIAMPKMDGYWYSLIKTGNGQIYLFSRSPSKKTGFYSEKIDNVPHIKEWAEQLPNDTILVGEIYYPGGTSKNVTSIMGCLPAKAVERQKGEYGYIHYYMHDILRYAGKDFVREEVDFEHRYSILCSEIDIKLKHIPQTEVAPSKTGFDIEDTIASWMDNGLEGGVLKLKSGLYLPGKRKLEMFKIKQDAGNMDFVITGLIDPVREYTGKEAETWEYKDFDGTLITKAYAKGWKMGFSIGLYDGDRLIETGKVTSGLDDEMREDIAAHPDNYIGSVVEVSAMSVDKKEKSLRHPVFQRMRPDKPSTDCILETIF